MNPKWGGCFTDESFIGHMSRATRKSHPSRVALSSMARWLLKMESIFVNTPTIIANLI